MKDLTECLLLHAKKHVEKADTEKKYDDFTRFGPKYVQTHYGNPDFFPKWPTNLSQWPFGLKYIYFHY